MLRIDHLEISADPRRPRSLIAGLSLSVAPGEVLVIKGPSGCGKTTLLRSIAGLLDPVGGTVTLDGKTPDQIGWPIFRSRVSLVPQRPVLWDGSVASNLQRPCAFATHRSGFDSNHAEERLNRVGLAGTLGTQSTTLSEGERQRVCLVRALLARPDVLLLDEPTSALDDESAKKIESLLSHDMKEHNLGILIVTHASGFADRFCTRMIDLSDYLPTSQTARQAVADA